MWTGFTGYFAILATGFTAWNGDIYTFSGMFIADALAHAPVVSNQVRYNLFDRDIETADLGFCERSGVGILVHSPLAKGLLTGRYEAGHRFAVIDGQLFPKSGERTPCG